MVYVRDSRDWYYRYSHLQSFDVQPGDRVVAGQKFGVLGKEGSSGGWSHLHFDIKARQPSGKWGTEDGYAFLWEAYRNEHHPPVIAVARPHHLIWEGETVTLDGSRSWSADGERPAYEWTFADGTTAAGPRVERTYATSGEYSEILKVVDAHGNVDYDFAIVLVIGRQRDMQHSPTIHANYAPTWNIHPGDPVTFKVRSFYFTPLGETWDFGDGTPQVQVHSDGNTDPHARDGYAETIHRFEKAGHHLVRVQHQAPDGRIAMARMHVHVEDPVARPDASWRPWLERKLLPLEEAQQMLPSFIESQLQPLPVPQTLADWQARREDLRLEILQLLGLDDLLPPSWDLKLTSQGVLQRDGYRIEKITYETYPGFAVGALLYVPDALQGRVPALVSISGHTPDSKAADYVQQRNINLVKRGCVVLSYDYFGYGDRKTGDDPRHPTGANGHGNRSFSYSRRTATALEVLDAARALDVLCGRSEVDPQRIGFTGESGGSNSTYWVAALDERVKLAVPVSSVTTFDYWIRGDINWDWHQRPPGIRRVADIGTLLALHAPHPLVVISSQRGTDDQEFPLQEAAKSYRWSKHVYELYGQQEDVLHYESTTNHGYQQDKREQLYAAVERWLDPPNPEAGRELSAQMESISDLACGLPADNETFRSIMTGWVTPLPRAASNNLTEQRVFLKQRLGWPSELAAPKRHVLAIDEQGGWRAEFWAVESELGIRLPVIVIRSSTAASDAAVTLVPGRDAAAVAEVLGRGGVAVAFDLRGMGESASGGAGHWASMAGEPWPTLLGNSGASWTNWSWFAGRPPPGQWALDIVQIARACCQAFDVPSVAIAADNDFGWPALLAGAAEPDLVASGVARVSHGSLRDDLRARGDDALADVPGLLEKLDIPQIRRMWPGTVTLPR